MATRSLTTYRHAIHLTIVTGLANRKHYEIALGPLARETRDSICGEVSFDVDVRDAGILMESIMEFGAHPPNVEAPLHVRRQLALPRVTEEAVLMREDSVGVAIVFPGCDC